MERKHIPLEKITILEDAIGWLSDYKTPNEAKVARNKFELDVENTLLLDEIGRLNLRREKLIKKLLENSKAKK